MNRKALLMMIIGVFFVLFGTIYILFSQTIKDSNNQKEIINTIDKNYEKFKNLGDSFTEQRKIMYDKIFNDLYVESLSDEYDNWFIEFKNYEKILKDINTYKKFLTDYCMEDSYINTNIKSKCDSMNIAYETEINYYVKDVNKFNEVVDKYNENVTDSSQLAKVNLNNINYIDFNNDGNYTGK